MPENDVIDCPLHGIVPVDPCPAEEVAARRAPSLEPGRPQDDAVPAGTLTDDGEDLDLCKQNLGPAGCASPRCGGALANNTQVRSLLLGTDGIGDSGARSVADLIRRNGRIETVYLDAAYGIATPEGTAALADAARGCRRVTGLWLKRIRSAPRARAARQHASPQSQSAHAGLSSSADPQHRDWPSSGKSARRIHPCKRLYLGGNQLAIRN